MSSKRKTDRTQQKYIGKKHNSWTLVNGTLWLLNSMMAGLSIYLIYRYHFFAFKQVNHLLAAISVILLIVGLLLILKQKAPKWICACLIAGLIVSSGAVYALNSAVHLAKTVTKKAEYAELELSIAVLADSPINDVKMLADVSAPTQNDAEQVNKIVEQVQKQTGVALAVQSVADYVTAYEALVRGETQAIVLNSAYHDFIAAVDPDYKSKIKIIYTYKTTQAIDVAPPSEQTAETFHVYVSGIDTYGPVATVSRSDVNIIMTINRQTKTVLLTTTPRDSYVAITDGGNNQYDKLTHAGIYGLNASIHTLEQLYGIDIQYYMRLNFTSFLKLIDHVGGITVTNDQAFTSLHGNYEFPAGEITLNAEQALSFVRERYSLNEGDHDRGKNQEKVIAALIHQLSTPQALRQAPAILEDLSTSIQTNMDLTVINGLINDQLNSNQRYRVISQAVTGTGTMELPSYAMPNAQLYMLQLDPQSIEAARAQIQQVSEGEVP